MRDYECPTCYRLTSVKDASCHRCRQREEKDVESVRDAFRRAFPWGGDDE